MTDKTAERKLRAARGKVSFLRPYFSHAVFSLVLVESRSCPTLAVDIHKRLYYSPEFVLQHDVGQLCTIVIHELGHVLRDHLKRARALGITSATAHVANVGQDCFPTGTTLGDGMPIERGRTQTLGGNGTPTSCTNLGRPWNDEVITLGGHGIELACTPDHPVWIYPRRHKVGLTPVRVKDPLWVPAEKIRVGDFMLVPDVGGRVSERSIDLHRYGGAENRSVLRTFPLTEETAWMLGLYTAEGSGKVCPLYSLGAHERHLVDRLLTIGTSLGFQCDSREASSTPNGVNVRVGGTVLARAFKNWCGDGSKNKRVPSFILHHSDTRLVRAYLEGLVDGDGHERRGKIRRTLLDTSSRGLATQIRLLLARLALGFSGSTRVQKRRKIGDRVIEGGGLLYRVAWRWTPGESTRVLNGKTVKSWSRSWRRCDEGILIPIKKMTRSHYRGTVHNLNCDGDQTFIAEGVKVHNCELNDDLRDEVEERGDLTPLPDWVMYPNKIGCPDYKSWEFYYLHLMDNATVLPFGTPADFGIPGSSGSGGPGGEKAIHAPQDCGSGAHGVKRSWELGSPSVSGTEGVTDADWRDVQRLTAEAIAERQRTRGDVAGGWTDWADTLLKPKIIPWDQELASNLRWAIHDVAGDVLHSYKRPSRRQSAAPNIIFPSMRRPRPFVCVIGDTSGSMSKEDLAYVRGVVRDICLAMNARVAFLATDAKVHKGVQMVHDGTDVVLAGRGGTNMAVGIEYALSNKLRPRPDVLVVITDCETPWPEKAPLVKTIVCAIGDSDDIKKVPPWARLIRVDPRVDALEEASRPGPAR